MRVSMVALVTLPPWLVVSVTVRLPMLLMLLPPLPADHARAPYTSLPVLVNADTLGEACLTDKAEPDRSPSLPPAK
jgi:hypothetical protein